MYFCGEKHRHTIMAYKAIDIAKKIVCKTDDVALTTFDEAYMQNLIQLSAPAWKDVTDADAWVHELREECSLNPFAL